MEISVLRGRDSSFGILLWLPVPYTDAGLSDHASRRRVLELPARRAAAGRPPRPHARHVRVRARRRRAVPP